MSKIEFKKIISWLFQNDLVSTSFKLRSQQNKAKERSTELSVFDIYLFHFRTPVCSAKRAAPV